MNKDFEKFIKSFHYAGEGIKTGFKERSMKIHGAMAVVVVMAGLIVGLSIWQWILVIMLIGMVWGAELINSSIEQMADLLRDTHKYEYKTTKAVRDMAAGAVLVTAMAAAVVGLIIFGSKFFG
jgi:undecaprenol kinase